MVHEGIVECFDNIQGAAEVMPFLLFEFSRFCMISLF